MKFGFMKRKGTTDAIFTVRQMQENFVVKGKKLYFGFVDLEKAFDRVPREVIRWAVRKFFNSTMLGLNLNLPKVGQGRLMNAVVTFGSRCRFGPKQCSVLLLDS